MMLPLPNLIFFPTTRFAGWMLGMHCNYNVWWSRAAMAWCWGMYINGIGVYGRDPILTCEYAYFVATDNHCPFVMAYSTSSLENHLPPSPADWRNCSSHGMTTIAEKPRGDCALGFCLVVRGS
eukprot:scaffold8529_cov137-Cylindrotheca_fusiformis.AAC.18